MKRKWLSFVLALTMVLCMEISVLVCAVASVNLSTREGTLATCRGATAVIDSNNSLWVWGRADEGILGTSTSEKEVEPRKIMDNVASFYCNGYNAPYYAVIKTDGSLWMWGNTRSNQIGNGKNYEYDEDQITPTKVMDQVAYVSCGPLHVAAIKTDGSLWTWGTNSHAQLGIGTCGMKDYDESYKNVPQKVMDDVIAVSCGKEHTAAVKSDGSLWMWGHNEGNKFNNGGESNLKIPFLSTNINIQTVPLRVMEGVADVCCGENPPQVLKADGTLVTWPEYDQTIENHLDESGKPIIRNVSPTKPMPLKALAEDVVYMTQGPHHTLSLATFAFLKKDNSLWTYGDNGYGNLGIGSDIASSSKPIKVLDDVATISVSDLNVFAMKTDGSIWGWGGIESNVLLDGKTGNVERKVWNIMAGQISYRCQTVPLQVTNIIGKVPATGNISTPSVPTVGGFADVKPSDYFADAVLWATEKDITSGTSAVTFSPNATCTRAQILTFLWRANGSPEPRPYFFRDVLLTDYYDKPASWAAEKGMVSGSTFDPDTPCTRATTVEYLWKAAGCPTAAKQASFNDVPASADYAQAVAWAVENEITSGTGGGNFSPNATCTRGQIATFLYRAMGS